MKLSNVRLLLYFLFAVITFFGASSRWRSRYGRDVVDPLNLAREAVTSQCSAASICELFAPHDDLEGILIGLIMAEEKKLQLAAFKLTSKDVARALLDAHNRGVTVEVVADSGGLDTRTNQIIKLHCGGIPVFIYPDPEVVEGRYSLMHNKFLICHHSRLSGGMILWTGSFNFTKSAAEYNRENALVILSEKIARSYAKEFEKLKSESAKLQRVGDERCA